eukprot:gnl/TRDRNA2_/TRDRNA2_175425_c1_seq10.p1 gnl/TRDRNA2_/TRDRNA2_175425_c1~~gnl/TRDRNA2_/TRDRNA2_175425_c1_seq10.p1  ORF type:complete len:438 (-),score=66.41 gnl/TRDRNA2_/TRDRNA2_175425_c1_seq10:114-1292(-)
MARSLSTLAQALQKNRTDTEEMTAKYRRAWAGLDAIIPFVHNRPMGRSTLLAETFGSWVNHRLAFQLFSTKDALALCRSTADELRSRLQRSQASLETVGPQVFEPWKRISLLAQGFSAWASWKLREHLARAEQSLSKGQKEAAELGAQLSLAHAEKEKLTTFVNRARSGYDSISGLAFARVERDGLISSIFRGWASHRHRENLEKIKQQTAAHRALAEKQRMEMRTQMLSMMNEHDRELSRHLSDPDGQSSVGSAPPPASTIPASWSGSQIGSLQLPPTPDSYFAPAGPRKSIGNRWTPRNTSEVGTPLMSGAATPRQSFPSTPRVHATSFDATPSFSPIAATPSHSPSQLHEESFWSPDEKEEVDRLEGDQEVVPTRKFSNSSTTRLPSWE